MDNTEEEQVAKFVDCVAKEFISQARKFGLVTGVLMALTLTSIVGVVSNWGSASMAEPLWIGVGCTAFALAIASIFEFIGWLVAAYMMVNWSYLT